MSEHRKCYKLEQIDFKNLKKGDLFILIDPDRIVTDDEGNTIFEAKSNPGPSEGVYGVKVKPYHG